MLFNSYEFLFAFFPICIGVYLAIQAFNTRVALWWLSIASIVFYGYWSPVYLFLIGGSIIGNYSISLAIASFGKRWIVILGVVMNLAAIGYFKYAIFLADIISAGNIPDYISSIVLPLAISFFTFQQIAYLIDIYKGDVKVGRFDNYVLFVTFFPQLIAGPIVRYQQIVGQFERKQENERSKKYYLVIGFIIFIIGLSKKVLIADTLSTYANDVFFKVNNGYELTFVDAWIGALSYSMQLYFDFSGYSDMAIGLGLMLGFNLPLNFYSPYRALNITEFWRSWHITLSRFFRDYLYIPLGGNRVGLARQATNLMLVMFLVGLWHGAGWTFIIWGVYHGFLLLSHSAIKHSLPMILPDHMKQKLTTIFSDNYFIRKFYSMASWGATFLLVVIGWVMFRAETVDVAFMVYSGMLFENKFFLELGGALIDYRLYPLAIILILISMIIAICFPNTPQLVSKLHKIQGMDDRSLINRKPLFNFKLRLSTGTAIFIGILSYLTMTTVGNVSTEFLYFNF